ncbi:hypothetical protein PHABIO_395 [Pseudomonas phage Phabio]|uniref:Uncharacterized protein n=1 Tax=Pseudomonas phage Phabio TaxID=2006668 RepID=A0A1Y0SZC3_9CAUD|nr:hypothetical protein MZD05_gp395 [Pseudomonas phage Phabio]ARV77026.1 hypothetical protein PHABIO_395 [Pseudomonas phage Phabio]
MLNKVERGSVPLGGHAASMGVLPELCNDHNVQVSYKDGTTGIASHVATNGQYFSLERLLGGSVNFDHIVLDEISYVDSTGALAIYQIPESAPVPFKTGRVFTLGYVTKLNGLRWGFNFEYDPVNGRGQLVSDPGSPIIGACFHFVNHVA